ncbi:MAG: uncharacterized membrane protein YraQ (UPF0718 family) [Psychromonas sp.]|jgi:uncharacterized membrane protein YraQ (UPF0718 family)|uniref:hypothetical protein n=1 Tax=Psychromonas sp. TaxID=1884585 RepID=UPI0039E6CB18
MTRKSLHHQIQTVNQRLTLRQEKFHRTSEQSITALQKMHPYLLIGTGLVAGAVASTMGWYKVYTAATVGPRFYSFLISRLMGMKND